MLTLLNFTNNLNKIWFCLFAVIGRLLPKLLNSRIVDKRCYKNLFIVYTAWKESLRRCHCEH